MSIFIYSATDSFKQSSVQFSNRGIKGQPCSAFDQSHGVLSGINAPGFGDLIDNIHIALAAISSSDGIASRLSGPVQFDSDVVPTLPLAPPSIYFQATRELTDEECLRFHCVTKKSVRVAEHTYTTPGPDLPIIQGVTISHAGTASPARHVSPTGYSSLLFTWKVINAFCALTSTLPEFFAGPFSTSSDVVRTFTKRSIETLAPGTGRAVNYKLKGGRVRTVDPSAMTETEEWYEFGIRLPTPLQYVQSDAPVNDHKHGLVFPYFHRMINSDHNIVTSVMSRYFSKLFINEEEQLVPRAFTKYQKDISTVMGTPQGEELCHMMIGVDYAIRSKGQLEVVITDRKYRGFTVRSGDFTYYGNGALVPCVEASRVVELVGEFQSHGKALGRLAEILSRIVIVQGDARIRGKKQNLNMSSFGSSFLIWKRIWQRGGASISDDVKREIMELLLHVDFEEEAFVAINPRNLMDILPNLKDSSSVADSHKRYLRDGAVFGDTLTNNLSIFGPQFPTLFFPSEKKTPIAKDDTHDAVIQMRDVIRIDPKSKKEITVKERQLKGLYIRRTTWEEATAQWRKLIKDGGVYQPIRGLDKKSASGHVAISEPTLLLEFWKALRIYYVEPVVPSKPALEERDAESEGQDDSIVDADLGLY